MPFGPHTSPSIALSLLKAQFPEQSDVSVAVRYFSIDFAELIGEKHYASISTDSGAPAIRELAGEWLFRDALFDTETDPSAYVDEVLRRRAAWPRAAGKRPLSARVIARLLKIREKVEPFLDRCADEIVALNPKIVGFTSVFQQHVASLALARRLKQRAPHITNLFGGANCEGVMGAETLRQFPFVDVVVSGEGDLIFPTLVRRILGGESIDGLAGVRTRRNIDDSFRLQTYSNAPVVRDMDALPWPDYSDFFSQFEASRLSEEWQPGLYFETSRGCWWGEKMHCTFCGLNGGTMAFRSKSSARALEELTALATSFPDCDVQVTDNILDLQYFKDFLPALAEAKLPVDLFYETKANLTREQIRLLAAANIRKIQPGIESLSDAVLKLMRKGVSAMQNVQLLKWCKEFGVHPYWNLLWGFPNEPQEEYAAMARLVPQLTHLPAPIGVAGLRLDRFSPNFIAAEQYGFANVRPLVPYNHIYALDPGAVANLAYYFDFDYRDHRDVAAYVAPLLRELQRWQQAPAWNDVIAFDNGDHLAIWDLRPAAGEALTVLEGIDRRLYLAADSASDLRTLTQQQSEESAEVEGRLERLVDSGLMLRDGNRFLSLAINVGVYQPSAETMSHLQELVHKRGRRERDSVVVPITESRIHVGRSHSTRSEPRLPRCSMKEFVVNEHNELVMQW
jgi:ribosomal peptide maturation radical SAM protein 1